MTKDSVIKAQNIEEIIRFIRGQKVIIDADLAALYEVETKRLNEQVKRNASRFPEDFMFRLTENEKAEVVANCDHLEKLKYSKNLPIAFTEHGSIMAASVLNSPRAIEVSVFVVRAFVRLRTMLESNRELARKLEQMEKKYDHQFKMVFDAIRQLMTPPSKPKRRIGFKGDDK